jgi:hypothetical protein
MAAFRVFHPVKERDLHIPANRRSCRAPEAEELLFDGGSPNAPHRGVARTEAYGFAPHDQITSKIRIDQERRMWARNV